VHGDPTNLGDEVPRGTLQVLGGGPLPADTKGSGRLQLANWIASKDNPLTARVIVNRLWQGHFGRGIVPTPNNFGTRGVPPSDQALLDYLATELVAKRLVDQGDAAGDGALACVPAVDGEDRGERRD
jgi:hypothetical protein